MEKTNIIMGSPNVEGNIGSCEIKATNISKDSWHYTTMAVNSCTGEIVTQNTYFDWSVIYYPVAIVFVLGAIITLFIHSCNN